MAADPKLTLPRRRVRRNTKTLDALKAGAVVTLILIGCIVLMWIASQLMRAKEPPQDYTPQHNRPLWDTSPERP